MPTERITVRVDLTFSKPTEDGRSYQQLSQLLHIDVALPEGVTLEETSAMTTGLYKSIPPVIAVDMRGDSGPFGG